MRKFFVIGSEEYELTPLTFEEFEKLDRWTGANDLAYQQFLRHNHFHELTDFNDETRREGRLELREGTPVIDWSVRYGDR